MKRLLRHWMLRGEGEWVDRWVEGRERQGKRGREREVSKDLRQDGK